MTNNYPVHNILILILSVCVYMLTLMQALIIVHGADVTRVIQTLLVSI